MLSEPQELAGHVQISSTTDGSDLISLPTEIYESILDELVEWPETLRACALVSHLFAQLAQKLLFSPICLKRPTQAFDLLLGKRLYSVRQPSKRFLNRFFRILSSSPHLAGYVKSLIVVIIDQYTSSDNAVQQILSLLANLEELGLAGDTRDSKLAFLDWGNDLRMGILELCSSDRLVKICLVHVSFPLSALGLAPRLETLKLRHVLFISDSELDHDHRTYGSGFGFEFRWYIMRKEKHPPAILKHVSVTSTNAEEWSACYPWLVSHLDLTHIKTLELDIDFDDADEETAEEARQAILDLLSGCSATLETLRLFMPDLEECRFTFRSFM